MKLYSWNVNGIRASINKGALHKFIKNEKPDIICLQETKADRDQVDIDFDGYYEYWSSAKKKGYSGTAIFSKIKPIEVIYGFTPEINAKYNLAGDAYGDVSEEGRVITAEFKDFYIVNVYTPNAKEDLSRLKLRHKLWDPAFLEYVKTLNKSKPVLMCGDFNVAHKEIDLARPKENVGKHGFTNEEREGFDKFFESGFVDTFRIFEKEGGHYTWWSHWGKSRERNVGWRIDYWLITKDLSKNVINAKIHPEYFGSDHCPVSIEVDLQ